MSRSLEQTLAFHCAPALAGLKPADLISCDPSRYPEMETQLSELRQALAPAGICLHPFHPRPRRTLLLVYRREVLERHLHQPQVKSFLSRAGYPAGDRETVLRHMGSRLCTAEDFPHEIGILLGYPPEDVEGFLRHHGKNYKLCGYWKVYGDEVWARARFDRFTRCRTALCAVLGRGVTLSQLFCAA